MSKQLRAFTFLSLLGLLMGAGCASIQREHQLQRAIALTPSHFQRTAVVQDDSLDTVAIVTTQNGFQERRGLFGLVWDDNFLRAHIDKRSGLTVFQVYQTLYYQRSGWNFFSIVNYESPDGPKSEALRVLGRDVNCAGSSYGGCTYKEILAFEVEESLLQQLASSYSPGQPRAWRFKYIAQSGVQWQDGLLLAEISGLLAKVEEYRRARGFVTNSPIADTISNKPAPSFNDFGDPVGEQRPVPSNSPLPRKTNSSRPHVVQGNPAPDTSDGRESPQDTMTSESDDEYNRRLWETQAQHAR